MKRLSQFEIESHLEDEMGDSMTGMTWHNTKPVPAAMSNETLNLLRTVAKALGGRQLTDAERDAVLYEKLPAKFSRGLPTRPAKGAEAEHVALREKLLAI
jgi:hypothetical protein